MKSKLQLADRMGENRSQGVTYADINLLQTRNTDHWQPTKDPSPAVNSDQYLGFDDRVEYVQVKCQHNLAIDQETEREQNEVGKKI